MLNFLHAGAMGDVIASLPYIRGMGGGHLYLHVDVPADTQTGSGRVLLNQENAESLLPLLRSCLYLTGASIWNGEDIDVHLDRFREVPPPHRYHNLYTGYQYLSPVDLQLGKPWLNGSNTGHGQIILNRTLRYPGGLDWSGWASLPEAVFLGTHLEWTDFTNKFGHVQLVGASDCLEMAKMINSSFGVVCNQSLVWHIAQGLGSFRVLEVCNQPGTQNSGIVGSGGFECINQTTFDQILNRVNEHI